MLRGLRVLVADDHHAHRALLGNIFAAFGCTVTVVADGGQAMAAHGPFDLMCLDRHMPILTGPEVAAARRGQAFLVAYTSDPSPGLGAFDMILTKPVHALDIARALAEATVWRGRHRIRDGEDTERRYSTPGERRSAL